jgi:transposase InsO family protein
MSDYLTRWPEVFAVKNQEAVTIAGLIVDEVIPRHGAPEYLLSDLGSNFMSALVSEVCRLAKINRLRTSSYHPQTDGLVERFNATLIQILSMYTNTKQTDWDLYLPQALFAYRICPQESTQISPFMLLYGREARLPLDTLLLAPRDGYIDTASYLADIIDKFKFLHKAAKDSLVESQKRMKAIYDRKASSSAPSFQVGDKVLVKVPRIKVGVSKKFMHPYRGRTK